MTHADDEFFLIERGAQGIRAHDAHRGDQQRERRIPIVPGDSGDVHLVRVYAADEHVSGQAHRDEDLLAFTQRARGIENRAALVHKGVKKVAQLLVLYRVVLRADDAEDVDLSGRKGLSRIVAYASGAGSPVSSPRHVGGDLRTFQPPRCPSVIASCAVKAPGSTVPSWCHAGTLAVTKDSI